MTHIILKVDTDNPIETAEGVEYLIPELHDSISKHQLNLLKERGAVIDNKFEEIKKDDTI